MSESTMTARVTLSWVPVTDARGRVRLEMRWSDPAASADDPRASASASTPAVASALAIHAA